MTQTPSSLPLGLVFRPNFYVPDKIVTCFFNSKYLSWSVS